MFNAKERFFLIGQILGNTSFQPSEIFLDELRAELPIEIPPAEKMFAAMDYHLDWLYAAVAMSDTAEDNVHYPDAPIGVKGTQEDVDFLLAWQHDNSFHIVIIEAKGVTSWTNKQIESKAERLRDFFGNDGQKIDNVTPHFVLMSPRKSVDLRKNVCPEWMCPGGQFHWMELKNSDNYGTHRVGRLPGKNRKKYDGWKVFAR
jgi:hypothetical protein